MSRYVTVPRRGMALQVKIGAAEVTLGEIAEARLARPKQRSECKDGPRPCPFLGCRYHLAMDAVAGSLKFPFGEEVDLEQLKDTCALDVADRGGATLEEIGQRMGVTREFIRQVEHRGMVAVQRRADEFDVNLKKDE